MSIEHGDATRRLSSDAGQSRRCSQFVFTPLSAAEGNAQSRYELAAANVAILNDYWDGHSSREARFVELLRARFPRAGVQDLTPVLDELRSGSGAPQIHQAIFGCLACQSVKL